jgi:hypothetical protein
MVPAADGGRRRAGGGARDDDREMMRCLLRRLRMWLELIRNGRRETGVHQIAMAVTSWLVYFRTPEGALQSQAPEIGNDDNGKGHPNIENACPDVAFR